MAVLATGMLAPATASALPEIGAPAATAGALDALVPPGATPPAEVSIVDNTFVPSSLQVPVGTTVRWTNQGSPGHTVTSGEFNSGSLAAGEAYSVTFDGPGTFVFFDRTLGTPQGDGMAGTVVVGSGVAPPSQPRPVTRVPQDKPTIQSAVTSAAPGTLILVAEGVYRESVSVTGARNGITIRGESRNGTIVDGERSRANGIFVNGPDDVTVEDITIRNVNNNGLFFNFSDRYRGDRVRSLDNAIYGIYAFHSVDGVFRNSYASGSGDAGIYIGECVECRSTVAYNLIEKNVIGYSGTNAGGVTIRDNEWRGNAVAIAPNSLVLLEDFAPPTTGTIVGNWIHDNNGWDIPRAGFPTFFDFPSGTGIWLAGAWAFRVQGNLIERHDRYGVVASWLSTPANDNMITGNIVRAGAKGDLAWDGVGKGTCFSGNDFATSSPPLIETLYPCSLPTTVGVWYPLIDADIYYGVLRQLACTGALDDICPRDLPVPPGPGRP